MNNRINELAAEIGRHDHIFWVENSFEITDSEYDALVEELRRLDPEHPVLHKVQGAPGKVTHPEPMLSLDKRYSGEEILAWARSVARGPEERFGVSSKWDGCAGRWEFERDQYGLDWPKKLVSRGDGFQGEDWSHHRHLITHLGASERGEILVTKSNFEKYVDEIERLLGRRYKNPRSMAAGILSNHSMPAGFPAALTFIPYTLDEEVVTLDELAELNWEATMSAAQASNIPADGLVIRLMDLEYAESLGATDHHPRGVMALKFKNPTGRTRLVEVEWSCGKGKITPVGIVEPCTISGTTTTRCSLHNMRIIAQKDIHVGDEIELEKCGDIIPGIRRVVTPAAGRVRISCDACPACGVIPEVRGVDLVCPNLNCGGTDAKRLRDALVRMGIETIGPGIVSELIKADQRTVRQVFAMTVMDWRNLPGFAQKSATQAFNEIERRRLTPIEDYRILAAMNIPGVGLTLSKVICDKFNLGELHQEDLTKLDGIGETRALELKVNFDQGFYMWAVCNLQIIETKGLASRPTICFTGKSERTREEWIRFAEARGYAFSKGVTKTLALLVCDDLDTISGKKIKAKKYGVKVMTYSDFEQVAA
jgi:DNA ligase (NAD+)